MRVVWTIDAQRGISQVLAYIDSESPQAADKMRDDIVAAGNSLAAQPTKAPREPLLANNQQEYRGLIVRRRYKLIYYINEVTDTVNIVLLWDTKQHPDRLKNWFFN